MAGIDGLKNRILQEGRDKAREIEHEAEEKALGIINDANAKASAIVENARVKAEKDGKDSMDRIISGARMEARNSALSVKQEMIDSVFSGVVEKIASMEGPDYSAFIENLILDNVEYGDEEVIFSESDSKKLDEGILELVNERLKAAGKVGKLHKGGSAPQMPSGFVLRRGGVEINCSIESLVWSLRDSIESEIAGMLFQCR